MYRMFSGNITIPQSVHAVPKGYGQIKSISIDSKNPAYKNINSSQIIISKTIEVKK